MNNTLTPPKIEEGYVLSPNTGLVVPSSYNQAAMMQSQMANIQQQSIITEDGYQHGVKLDRDSGTLIVKWPKKGSGWDDLCADAIVDGNVSNVGIAPVVAPYISAMVLRQQLQGLTASIELTGRKTPVRLAREAISRFDDSPLGASDAIMEIIRGLRTHNRGAPIATVPITYDMGQWQQYGMEAIEISHEKMPNRYYLQVDWSQVKSPVPFLPNIFDLEPTGNREWPYWYHARDGKDKKWVLLHHSQIIPLTLGKTSVPNIGISSVWLCLKHISENILVVDERIERMVNALADGILGISGVSQTAEQIQKKLEEHKTTGKMKGNILAKGHAVFTSPFNKIQFESFSFREDDGIPFTERVAEMQDFIALAFQVPLSEVVTRGGVGFGSQADTTADVNSEGGVGALLRLIALSLGGIYRRVQVAVNRPNDRAQRLNYTTLGTFATAMKDLHANGKIVLTPEEQKSIINRDIIDIPETDLEVIAVTVTSEDSEDEETTNEPIEQDEVPEKEEKSKGTADKDEDEEMALLWANQQHLERLISDFEPLIPEGADETIPASEIDPEAVDANEMDVYWDEDYANLLNAEVLESDNPDDIEDEGDSRWIWLTLAYLYITRNRDSEISRDEATNLRDSSIEERHTAMLGLVEQLGNRGISLATFSRSGWQLIHNSDVNEYRFGRGGLNAMTDRDAALLRTVLSSRQAEWDDLINRIGDGRYSTGQIRVYSGNFINGTTASYERGNAAAYGIYNMPQYPGDGQTDCGEGCKCGLRIVTLPGNGNSDVYWYMRRAEHCKDCPRLEMEWNPLRIRNGEIQ